MLLLNVVNVFFVKWIFNGTSLFLNNLKLKQHYLLIFYFLFWKREHVQHELMNLRQVHNNIYFTCGVSQLYKSEVRFVICDSLEFEFTYLVEDALYVTACKCCKEDILTSNKELELSFARLCGAAFAKLH